ncbi:hypothetical protein BJX99DRAFT_230229 [Aspergillus californicus]
MSSKGFAARAQSAGDQWTSSLSRSSGHSNNNISSSDSTNSGAHNTSSRGSTEEAGRQGH